MKSRVLIKKMRLASFHLLGENLLESYLCIPALKNNRTSAMKTAIHAFLRLKRLARTQARPTQLKLGVNQSTGYSTETTRNAESAMKR